MGYTREHILNLCQKAFSDINLFYKQKFINYGGKTTDTDELYTEVIAEFLCNNIDAYKSGISQITREESYKTLGHNGVYYKDSPREEEKIAMQIYLQSKNGMAYKHVGKVIDYQTPLKNKRADKAGKIDLLSFDEKVLYILELKKPDSDESMLRCVLEGYTYMKTANIAKLLDDFSLPANTDVCACPFVFSGSQQQQEMLQNRPWLFRLMALLNSKPYYITVINDTYNVEE